MSDASSRIRVDYQPDAMSARDRYCVTPSLPEFVCAVEAIFCWHLGDLGQCAAARHGYCNSDGGCGVTYPDDLEDYDREVDGASIPPGYVEVFGYFGGERHLIAEKAYLEILGQILRHNGLGTDADTVFELARCLP